MYVLKVRVCPQSKKEGQPTRRVRALGRTHSVGHNSHNKLGAVKCHSVSRESSFVEKRRFHAPLQGDGLKRVRLLGSEDDQRGATETVLTVIAPVSAAACRRIS